jgi:hypothetical protein
MKIQSLSSTLGYTGIVREKQEGGQGWQQNSSSGNHQQDASQKKQDSESQSDEEEVSVEPAKVDQALESFRLDAQAQVNGLVASKIGNGPGLKVVLKDQAGSIVRQFTGQEFIKLRSLTPRDQPSRGKILDRKL